MTKPNPSLEPDDGGSSAEPAGSRSGNWRRWRDALPLALAAVLATLLRGFAFLDDYPSGADYAHHLLAADHYLENGLRMIAYPWFQLGLTHYTQLPGAAMLYALVAASGSPSSFPLAPVTAALGALEVSGVFLLARRLYGPGPPPLLAALACATFPTGPAMISWAGYSNLVGIALTPFALLAWLEHWSRPDRRSAVLTAIAVGGLLGVHHLSSIWLLATLALFTLAMLFAEPRRSASRLASLLWPLAVAAIPAAVRLVEVALISQASGVQAADRLAAFQATRVGWSAWVNMTSPLGIVLAVGILAMLRDKTIRGQDRLAIGCYSLVTLLVVFGWTLGIAFYYVRAVYFLALPIALGFPALVRLAGGASARLALAVTLLAGLGTSSIAQAERDQAFYRVLTPEVVDAVRRLEAVSHEGDVVVCSTVLAYHLPWLIQRPLLPAMPPETIGNSEQSLLAADAVAVMTASSRLEEVLDARQVAFVLLSKRFPESGSDALAVHPRMSLLFQNEDVVLYEVRPR